MRFLIALLLASTASAQNLATVDTGWMVCNEGALASELTYPTLIAVDPNPCRELVIESITLQYRYSGSIYVLPDAPAPCYAGGGGGTVIFWTGAEPSTFYDHETGTWGGGGMVYGVQAGGGGWFQSCVQPGDTETFSDITTFGESMMSPQYAPCSSQLFTIVGERRGWPIARMWHTPQYRANGTSWYWGWQYPVPPGSWGSHSPMQYVEQPIEARHVFAYRWQ